MKNDEKTVEIPLYIKELIKHNPKLKSGRKNYKAHEKRILNTIKLIKKFVKKKNNFSK